MTITDLSPLANHLWQSTVFGVGVWFTTIALKQNRASVRYGLWLAASVKFLVPLAWLIDLGSRLGWRVAPVTGRPVLSLMVNQISQPFAIASEVRPLASTPAAIGLPALLLAVWFSGVLLGLFVWIRSMRQMRAIERAATRFHLDFPIPVMSSASRVEPGVFGFRKPVLLLPEGIADRLQPAQLRAVLAHELCHLRRRDNLTGAIHMVVETLFWFHPLLWWIRKQLVAERERACDEAVLLQGAPAEIYAESILRVCQFYLTSPADCVSGVTGGELKDRVVRITSEATGQVLSPVRKAILTAMAVAIVGGPLAVGVLTPHKAHAAEQKGRTEFEVASVKINKSGDPGTSVEALPGGRVEMRNGSLKTLISLAYHVRPNMIWGGPGWLDSDSYDINAKGSPKASEDELRVMLQNLLADRFKLQAHREEKLFTGYAITLAKTGATLPKPDASRRKDEGCEREAGTGAPGEHRVKCYMGMEKLAEALPMLAPGYFDRPVVDQTGLKGFYKFTLNWMGAAQINTSGGLTVFEAVEQLGLKLDSRKVSMPGVVVDHVERIPTEN